MKLWMLNVSSPYISAQWFVFIGPFSVDTWFNQSLRRPGQVSGVRCDMNVGTIRFEAIFLLMILLYWPNKKLGDWHFLAIPI